MLWEIIQTFAALIIITFACIAVYMEIKDRSKKRSTKKNELNEDTVTTSKTLIRAAIAETVTDSKLVILDQLAAEVLLIETERSKLNLDKAASRIKYDELSHRRSAINFMIKKIQNINIVNDIESSGELSDIINRMTINN